MYTTYQLTAPNPRITRALIMIHGTLRNPDVYFTTATAAAFLAGALDDTVVIAPRIASAQGRCRTISHHTRSATAAAATAGDPAASAANDASVTSFDFMDAILKRLANRQIFPNLRAIVVTGHSAGGQFVARYEMANRIHETLGVPVRYVVANPRATPGPT